MSRRPLILLLCALVFVGCRDEINVLPSPTPTPVTPTPPPAPVADRIEFRVLGTHRNVLVRHASAQDGTTQVTTDLPYFSTFTTLAPTMFLSLEASTLNSIVTGTPFLQVQILVNGTVVREASSNQSFPTLSINITYRR